MEAERVIEYFVDVNGTEIEDAEKNGKGVVFNGTLYREGQNVQITTESGIVYDGVIEKVSTLKPGSNKEIRVLDEHEVSHVIKYELMTDIKHVEVSEDKE